MYIYTWWGHTDIAEANEGQLLGKWSSESNAIFQLPNCINNVMYGKVVDGDIAIGGGSDWVKCTKYVVLEVTTIVLIVLFFILLCIQIKKYGCHREMVLFKKVKTWILILAISFLSLYFISQLITAQAMNWAIYSLLWVFISITRQLTVLAFFLYFAKRAKKLMTPVQV